MPLAWAWPSQRRGYHTPAQTSWVDPYAVRLVPLQRKSRGRSAGREAPMNTRAMIPLTVALSFALVGCGTGNGTGSGGPQSYSLTFGPILVPAGTEATQCIVRRLGNPTPLHVGTVHNMLGEASHHMVVYRVNDTDEQTTPFACQPFQDTVLGNGSPIVISQKADDLLTMPPGVAY